MDRGAEARERFRALAAARDWTALLSHIGEFVLGLRPGSRDWNACWLLVVSYLDHARRQIQAEFDVSLRSRQASLRARLALPLSEAEREALREELRRDAEAAPHLLRDWLIQIERELVERFRRTSDFLGFELLDALLRRGVAVDVNATLERRARLFCTALNDAWVERLAMENLPALERQFRFLRGYSAAARFLATESRPAFSHWEAVEGAYGDPLGVNGRPVEACRSKRSAFVTPRAETIVSRPQPAWQWRRTRPSSPSLIERLACRSS